MEVLLCVGILLSVTTKRNTNNTNSICRAVRTERCEYLVQRAGVSLGIEICQRSYYSDHYWYCESGYYCCQHNQKCCSFSHPYRPFIPRHPPSRTAVTSPSSDDNSGLSGDAIAGIVIGSIAGLILLCVLCACVNKCCDNNKSTVQHLDSSQESPVGQTNPALPLQMRGRPDLTSHPGPSGRPENALHIPFPGDQDGSARLPGSTLDGMPPQYSRK